MWGRLQKWERKNPKLVIGYLLQGFGTLVMFGGVILLAWEIREDGIGIEDFVGLVLFAIGAAMVVRGSVMVRMTGRGLRR
jgi:hypothetical protein